MRYQFHRTEAGSVDVTLDDDLPVLLDALADSPGTCPPLGAREDGPSTYWLDSAIAHLRERMESGNPEPFASGNTTYLQLQGGRVEARYDYDPVDSDIVDRVDPAGLLDLLTEWQRLVLDASPEAARRLPPDRRARAAVRAFLHAQAVVANLPH
jgi:hypothetical protein